MKATAWIDNLVVVGPGEGGRYRVLDGIDVFAAARRFKGRGTKAGILCCSDDSLGLAGVPLVEDKHGAGAPGDDDKCHGHGWRDGPPGAGPYQRVREPRRILDGNFGGVSQEHGSCDDRQLVRVDQPARAPAGSGRSVASATGSPSTTGRPVSGPVWPGPRRVGLRVC